MEVGGQQGILGMGFYYRHLLEWMRFFPKERFLILIYEEELARDKAATLRRVYRHVGVDESFAPGDLEGRYNVRETDLLMILNYYTPRLTKRVFKRIPGLSRLRPPLIRISDQEYEDLRSFFEPENRLLEELLGRSLAVWDQPAPLRRGRS